MLPKPTIPMLITALALCIVTASASAPALEIDITQNELSEPWEESVVVPPREKLDQYPGCNTNTQSVRRVVDNFFSDSQVDELLTMMRTALKSSPEVGGPTIIDINSGLMRDSQGVVRFYESHRGFDGVEFTKEQYNVYGSIFDRIKASVEETNGVRNLYFTAPTFVARLVGEANWEAKEMHDEYWHPHVDKENTEHYDYSGLVYLSDHGTDFEGGEFMFMDEGKNTTVLPRKGRLITFSAGSENLHRVLPVTSGVRFTMSMWFTCNPKMHFTKFLDGKAHRHFTQAKEEL